MKPIMATLESKVLGRHLLTIERDFSHSNTGLSTPLGNPSRKVASGYNSNARIFLTEQGAFALDAPAVAGEGAVGTDDAMTGDEDGEFIGGAGPGDGADGLGQADALGNLGVAGGLAEGNFGECPPHALLEGGATDVERKLEAEARIFDQADDLGDEFFEFAVRANEVSLGKTILEIAGEFVGIITEENGADTLVGRGDKDGAERGLPDGEADGRPVATAAKRLRFHAEGPGGFGVEAPVGNVARVVNGAGDAGTAGKFLADTFGTMRGGVGLRAEASHLGEDALKMKRTHANGAGQIGERERFVCGFDEAAGSSHDFGVMVGKRDSGVHAFRGDIRRILNSAH